jgi:Protein of unknown function (DUF4058)
MRPRFPGMDPWLEHPDLWPDVHDRLIIAISDSLMPRIMPRYVARVASRTTQLSGLDLDRIYRSYVTIRPGNFAALSQDAGVAILEHPDVKKARVIVPIIDEIEETFLTIQEVSSRKLVTAIEVLSPTNKKTKKPRAQYLDKRSEFLQAKVNLVEIDLLRAGRPMPLKDGVPSSDYRILICRPRLSRDADLYYFSVRIPIPVIPIPLLPGDVEPNLELNEILHALYERAGYELSIDYQQPPRPPLRTEDTFWAAPIVAQAAESARENSPRNGS